MRVSSKEAAWIVAKRLFRAEMELDSHLSRKSGHPVFTRKGRACPEYRIEEYHDRLDVYLGKVSYTVRIRDIASSQSDADPAAFMVEALIRERDEAKEVYEYASARYPDSKGSRDAWQRFAALENLVQKLILQGLIPEEYSLDYPRRAAV